MSCRWDLSPGSPCISTIRSHVCYHRVWESIPVWCVVASALVTVLMMWRSWNRTMPPVALRSEAGRFSLSTPVMVILGSLGCSTITTASVSGMVIHVSSPKHLEKTQRWSIREGGMAMTERDVAKAVDPDGRWFGFYSVTQQLSLDITWPHWFVTRHSNKEQGFEGLNASRVWTAVRSSSHVKVHVIIVMFLICKLKYVKVLIIALLTSLSFQNYYTLVYFFPSNKTS